MKTTIDIPKDVLEDAMKYTKAQTKRDAVETAVRDFNQRVRRAEISKRFGTFENFISQEELQKLRTSE